MLPITLQGYQAPTVGLEPTRRIPAVHLISSQAAYQLALSRHMVGKERIALTRAFDFSFTDWPACFNGLHPHLLNDPAQNWTAIAAVKVLFPSL